MSRAANRATVLLLSMALLVLMTSCAGSTVASRARERHESLLRLPATVREAAESGKVVRGMDTNAVYVALGRPARVVVHPDLESAMTWIYYGEYRQFQRQLVTWVGSSGRTAYTTTELEPGYVAQRRVRLQIEFENGVIVRCYESPKPVW